MIDLRFSADVPSSFREFAANRGGVLRVEGLEVALKSCAHISAGYADDVALRDGCSSDFLVVDNTCLDHLSRRTKWVIVDRISRRCVVSEKLLDCLRMLLQELTAHDCCARHEL